MSQRASGYARRPVEAYETIAWPIVALLLYLGPIQRAWECCDRNSGQLIATLRARNIEAIGTAQDFLTVTAVPADVSDLITNPPYGDNRRGELAVRFIEHALELKVPRVAMLLRINRIKWFEAPSSPSDNHAWFCWDRRHTGAPIIRYVTRKEAS
jgi:hypothetical protein